MYSSFLFFSPSRENDSWSIISDDKPIIFLHLILFEQLFNCILIHFFCSLSGFPPEKMLQFQIFPAIPLRYTLSKSFNSQHITKYIIFFKEP
jgi:hypothetical protein